MEFAKGQLAFKTITRDDRQFDMEGMVSPTFQNQGDTVAYINYNKVYPDEDFDPKAHNVVFTGTIPVTFEKMEGKTNKIMVNYTTLVGRTEVGDKGIASGCRN